MKIYLNNRTLRINVSGLPSYQIETKEKFDEGVKILLTEKQLENFKPESQSKLNATPRRIKTFNAWFMEN